MKLDLQILILFLLSVAALAFHYFVPRTLDIDARNNDWRVASSMIGPGSKPFSKITDRGVETNIHLIDRDQFNFANVVFRPPNDKGEVETGSMDLFWVSEVSLTAFIEGKDREFFRLFLMNQLPGVYDESDGSTRQCNEVALALTDEPQEFIYKISQFHVPSWWSETYGTKLDHSLPSFSAVDSVEIFTGSKVCETELNLVVQNIQLRGHWIPPIVLYRSLLAAWLVLATGVTIQKLITFKKALKLSGERENGLRQMNSQLEHKASELSKLAHHDSLTGLMNRLGILQYTSLIGDTVRKGKKVSLIVLDIDNFKQINDTHGHQHGDNALVGLGSLLAENATAMEIFARWGGEEFIAICFDRDENEASQLALTLATEIQVQLEITCSFGVYEVSNEGEEIHDSVDRADRAMYAAKTKGKNCVVKWSQLDRCVEASNSKETSDATSNVGSGQLVP